LKIILAAFLFLPAVAFAEFADKERPPEVLPLGEPQTPPPGVWVSGGVGSGWETDTVGVRAGLFVRLPSGVTFGARGIVDAIHDIDRMSELALLFGHTVLVTEFLFTASCGPALVIVPPEDGQLTIPLHLGFSVEVGAGWRMTRHLALSVYLAGDMNTASPAVVVTFGLDAGFF
jgi:hypothetical protein